MSNQPSEPTPTTSLTRERLISPPKKIVRVDLPDGIAFLTRIAESDLAIYEAGLYTAEGKVNEEAWKSQRRRTLVLCLCDADGQLLFTPSESDLLMTMDGAEAEALFAAYNTHFRARRPSIASLSKKSEAAGESGTPSESAAS